MQCFNPQSCIGTAKLHSMHSCSNHDVLRGMLNITRQHSHTIHHTNKCVQHVWATNSQQQQLPMPLYTFLPCVMPCNTKGTDGQHMAPTLFSCTSHIACRCCNRMRHFQEGVVPSTRPNLHNADQHTHKYYDAETAQQHARGTMACTVQIHSTTMPGTVTAALTATGISAPADYFTCQSSQHCRTSGDWQSPLVSDTPCQCLRISTCVGFGNHTIMTSCRGTSDRH